MSPFGIASLTRVRGVDVHWVEVGAGRPLVLLHGLCDSSATWAEVAPLLGKRRRVLAPDLAGHGLSSRPDASYALAWHADVVGAWLDALGLEDIDLAGHSFGGGVAQWLLLERARRVRRLALVAPGGLGHGVGLGLRLCALHAPVVERFGQPFMALGTRVGMLAAASGYGARDVDVLAWQNARPGSARALARTVRDVIDHRGQRRHFLDRAHEIAALPPTALYWGDRDPIIPASQAADAALWLENVHVTRFAGCGHFPHRERAADLARGLEAFLDARDAPRAVLRRTALVPVSRARRDAWWRRAARAIGRVFARSPRPARGGDRTLDGRAVAYKTV